MSCSAFMRGMGVGVVVGAALGMSVGMRQRPMKTCVGRTMQSVSQAMDSAIEDLFRSMG